MTIFYISANQKRAIRNAFVPLPVEIPPFGQNDGATYKFIVVRETGNPNSPTESIGTIESAIVALTDGDTTTYVEGVFVICADNTVQCQLPIVSDDLDALLLLSRFVPTYLELKITVADEGELTVFNEQVSVVRSSDTPPEDASGTLTFVDSATVSWQLLDS